MTGNLLDDLEERHRVELGASVLLGQAESHQPGFRQDAHEIGRKAPQRLGVVGEGAYLRTEGARRLEQR